ncbi:MAG TPA: hypothetical protein PKK12_06095 [Candidatus Aminicenantes bacterium]|nr:hypothetical protein [Candidatus Aminicenantes bacterium]
MRKLRNTCAVLAILLSVGVNLRAGDVLKRVGISPAQASTEMLYALTTGSFPVHLGTAAFLRGTPAERVDLVQSAVQWARAHAKTPAFLGAYRQWREENRPKLTAKAPVDEELRKQKAEMARQLAEMKKVMAQMPAEQRKQMEEAYQAVVAQQKQFESDAQMQAMMRQGMEMERKQAQSDHQKELQEFETNFPADPRPLIARRLKEFLDLSAGIDFAARLVPRGEFMVFSDERHERKDNRWKYCFRAGREVLAAARTAATSWLVELGQK